MSHTATVKVQFLDPHALAAAVEQVGATMELDAQVTFYDHTKARGTAIKLPGWDYPVVITADHQLKYDNYEGAWGDIAKLYDLRRAYAEHAAIREQLSEGQVLTNRVEDGLDIVLEFEIA